MVTLWILPKQYSVLEPGISHTQLGLVNYMRFFFFFFFLLLLLLFFSSCRVWERTEMNISFSCKMK